MILTRITAPAVKPLFLQKLKSHLRIETDDDDAYLDLLIDAAARYLDGAEGVLGRCLIQQVWELQIAGWPRLDGSMHAGHNFLTSLATMVSEIEIPLSPLVSVASIKYLDQAEIEQPLATNQYVVIPKGDQPAVIRPAYGVTWPVVAYWRPDAVRIRFTSGYAAFDSGGLSGEIPSNIVLCMMKAIGSAYENRDQAIDIYIDETLLAPSRFPVVA